MLDLIIQMLEIDDYMGVSQNIDIAKGVNEIPSSVKKGIEQHRRANQWQQ